MNTPVCPVCGAKFSHNNETKTCNKCGVSDLILGSPTLIGQWKAGKIDMQAQPLIEFRRPGTAGSKTRKRRKHGRSR